MTARFLFFSLLFSSAVSAIFALTAERKHTVYLRGGKNFTDAFPAAAALFISVFSANATVGLFRPDAVKTLDAVVIIALAVYATVQEAACVKRK